MWAPATHAAEVVLAVVEGVEEDTVGVGGGPHARGLRLTLLLDLRGEGPCQPCRVRVVAAVAC
jgi:hypothetical protein